VEAGSTWKICLASDFRCWYYALLYLSRLCGLLVSQILRNAARWEAQQNVNSVTTNSGMNSLSHLQSEPNAQTTPPVNVRG
jgi:hypothetical protein